MSSASLRRSPPPRASSKVSINSLPSTPATGISHPCPAGVAAGTAAAGALVARAGSGRAATGSDSLSAPLRPTIHAAEVSVAVTATVSTRSARLSAIRPGRPLGSVPVMVKLPGRHQVHNALAAAAVAWCLGLDARAVQQGLIDVRTE